MRAKILSGSIVAVVVLAWVAAASVAVGGAWSSLERPTRRPVSASAPSLKALDASIALAEPFLDGLYSAREDGTAVVSEYYGRPVGARFAGDRRWQLLGASQNRLQRLGSTTAEDIGLATFRSGAAS